MSNGESPWPDLVNGRLPRELWKVWGKNHYIPKIGDKCVMVNLNPVRSRLPFFCYVTVVMDDMQVYGIDNTVPGIELIPKIDIPRQWFFKRRI